jgi:hypothetical protein
LLSCKDLGQFNLDLPFKTTCLTKRVKIEYSFDYQFIGIGIASNEHIWKLCFEINQTLGINLLNQKDFTNFIPPKKVDIPDNQLLFQAEKLAQTPSSDNYYIDTTSNSRIEYILCSPERGLIPREARMFRYFFFARSLKYPLPKLDEILLRFNQISIVLSAIDISNIKNIKHLVL